MNTISNTNSGNINNESTGISILDRIRRDREAKNKKNPGLDFSEADTIEAKNFFLEFNTNGYMSVTELKPYVENLPDWNLQQLQVLFEYMSGGFRINSPLYKKDNVHGLPSYWLKFGLPNGNPTINVVLTGYLDKFFNDYQQRKIKIAFTLDQLYDIVDQYENQEDHVE